MSSFGVDLANIQQWQKLMNFCRNFGTEVTKDLNVVMEQKVKALSQQQNRDAVRKTGYMASQTKYMASGQNSFSAVSDAYYSIFVDQGTYKMAPRPFFTDNMNRHIPMIVEGANISFGNSIKRLLAF